MSATEKLSLISEVMADGYHFVNLRFLVEDWEGTPEAAEMLEAINKMYRLCKFIKDKA